MITPAPSPVYLHPFYREYMGCVWPWLNNPAAPPALSLPLLVEPVNPIDVTPEFDMPCVTLVKYKAAGVAPYVGEPSIYTWPVAFDRYGRAVAGEASLFPTGVDSQGRALPSWCFQPAKWDGVTLSDMPRPLAEALDPRFEEPS